MTDAEKAEIRLLRHANDRGKFAVPLGAQMALATQEALERLQEKRWIQLIDITPIAAGEGYYRIFLLSLEAISMKNHTAEMDIVPMGQLP